MPKARNVLAIQRQARTSFVLPADSPSELSVRAVIQQPSEAKKYKTTVSQPMNVGSPMPGDQLNVAMSAHPLP
jgi:hypothetical protein